jgi:CRP-like cAMP-binding protein
MSTVDAKTFLEKHCALFSGVSDAHLTALAVNSELKTVKAGQTVVFQGTTVEGLHVVIAGKVAVTAKVTGKGVIQVAELGPGEVFGEKSILEFGTSGAAVKGAQDGTMLLVIPQEAFKKLVAEDAAFVARLKALIASRSGGSSGGSPAGS